MRLTVTTFLTLDGVMQGPGAPDEDRSGGFAYGGWQAPYGDDDTGTTVTDIVRKADALLLGRVTYDIFAAYWPKVTDADHPVAGRFNVVPKYVASTTLTSPQWEHTTVLSDVAADVARLKEQPGDELQVWGSATLVQTLLAHGLVDEYRLWVYPVLLGEGKRLFSNVAAPTALRLVDSRTTNDGVVMLTYHPGGPATFGTVD